MYSLFIVGCRDSFVETLEDKNCFKMSGELFNISVWDYDGWKTFNKSDLINEVNAENDKMVSWLFFFY